MNHKKELLWSLRVGLQGPKFTVWGLADFFVGLKILGFGFWAQGLGFRVFGLGFKVSGLGCWV